MGIFKKTAGLFTLVVVALMTTLSCVCSPVFALNIAYGDLELYTKSDSVAVDQTSVTDDGKIAPDITFSKMGDFVTYKITLSDSDEADYKISSITDNNTNENITVSYTYDDIDDDSDKDIYITFTYSKELSSALNLSDFELLIGLEEEPDQDISVPNTGNFLQNDSGFMGLAGISWTMMACVVVALIAMISLLHFVFRGRVKSRSGRLAVGVAIVLFLAFSTTLGALRFVARASGSNSIRLFFDVSNIRVEVGAPVIRTARFVDNSDGAVANIDEQEKTCSSSFGQAACEIVLSDFEVNPGFKAIGWSTNPDSKEALYQPGETVLVSSDMVLYTITSKELTAAFNNQHSEYFTTSDNFKMCEIYNRETECSVVPPTIVKKSATSNAEFLGWSTVADAVEPMAGSLESITISEDTAYYSVASVPTTTISVLFMNADEDGVTWIEEDSRSCVLVDEETSCSIIIPDFSVADGYEKIGWNTNPGATTAKYTPGQEVSFSSSKTLYTISRTTYTASFINQHSSYFTASVDRVSCFVYNGAYRCSVTVPTVDKLSDNDDITFVGWSTDPSVPKGLLSPGQEIYINYMSNNKTYYSAVYGISYTITFDKNVDFLGSNTVWNGSNWRTQSNIAADSLSFYSENCVVTEDGCYLTSVPRIYSTGNTPLGFSLKQYGDAYIDYLMDLDFINDATVYARVFNWGNQEFITGATKKIYVPESTTEYFQIDFEDGFNGSFVDYIYNYLEEAFQNAPQLYSLRGKIRFYTRDSYINRHGTSSQMVAGPGELGTFVMIESRLANDNVVSLHDKFAFIHELGHALDAAWEELHGSRLSQLDDVQTVYDYWKSQYDIYMQTHATFSVNDGIPLRGYSYTNVVEFFGDAFATWYWLRAGIYNNTYGYISDDISQAIESYICGGEYADSVVCQASS